jgi:hypothetical protein
LRMARLQKQPTDLSHPLPDSGAQASV